MSERIAIVDLGSNSARLVIFQLYSQRAYHLIHERKEIVRLSEGASVSGELQVEAQRRGLETLRIFKETCRRFQVQHIIGVATAAVRNASNGQSFMEKVQQKIGWDFRTLSGEEEAYYGFLGIINTLPEKNFLQFDLGGGSIELAWVQNRKIKKSISLPLGAVNLTERFHTQDRLEEEKQKELFQWLTEKWQSIEWLKEAKDLPMIGTGGTIRTLARIDQRRKNYPFSKLHNYRMGAITFRSLCEELAKTNLRERQKVAGINDGRSDLILAGSQIILSLQHYLKSPRIIISGSGVRDGLFFEYYRSIVDKPPVISDILRHSAENISNFYELDKKHAERVVQHCVSLFHLLGDTLEFEKREEALLKTTALLHDVGLVVNYYNQGRHSAYLIENSLLYGLSHREQIFCAVLAAWQNNSGMKRIKYSYRQFLDERDWTKAKRLGIILGLAKAFEHDRAGAIKKITKTEEKGRVILTLFSTKKIDSVELLPFCKYFQKETNRELIFKIQRLGRKKY